MNLAPNILASKFQQQQLMRGRPHLWTENATLSSVEKRETVKLKSRVFERRTNTVVNTVAKRRMRRQCFFDHVFRDSISSFQEHQHLCEDKVNCLSLDCSVYSQHWMTLRWNSSKIKEDILHQISWRIVLICIVHLKCTSRKGLWLSQIWWGGYSRTCGS